MGLGKSAQAIAAADLINAQRILVICPASVRINWTREFRKFSTRTRTLCAWLSSSHRQNADVVTCSYDLALKHTTTLSQQWDVLILDESHFLKSLDAKRSQAILGRAGLVHHAARTWALSGTPAPNDVSELWPLLRVFGAVGGYQPYVDQFCKTRQTPYGTVVYGHKNLDQFRALIKPWILRRKKEEVMRDLPPILFGDVTVEAGEVDEEIQFPEYWIQKRIPELHNDLERQRAVMQGVVDMLGTGAEGLTVLGALLGDKSKVSTLRRYVGLQKVQGVADLVTDELNSGLDKIVIFAIHQGVIEGLREKLRGFGAVTLYGGSAPEARQRNVDKFARDPRCRVFIGNIQAAGVAIDGLQNQCCNVLLVEKYGVPGWMAQAIMRVHRKGQTRPVLVRSVRLENDDLFWRVEGALVRKTKDLVAAFD